MKTAFVKKTALTLFILGLLSIAARAESNGVLVTVQNRYPRTDVEGRILDVHDGCLEFFEGRFYLYGTRYGETDGFTTANRYVCYSSNDLTNWTFHGEILQDPPEGVYYRPYVKRNPKTGKYVLWYNWYPTLWDGQYGVATSESPEGPYVIHDSNVHVVRKKPGDHGLMVDDDGQGYLIYTSIAEGHAVSVERLTEDFLASAGENSGVLATGCEAASLFKREGVFYALFDSCCCFCPQGSGARVYSATEPLGSYTLRGNINRDEHGTPIVAAQQTHVAQLPTASGEVFIWMGDLWGSRPDGVKGHDLQYWSSPMVFLPDGSIAPLKREDLWTFLLPSAARN